MADSSAGIAVHVNLFCDCPELQSSFEAIVPLARLQACASCSLAFLEHRWAPAAQEVVLNLQIADADQGRRCNKAYRGKDYATNILTFEYGADDQGLLTSDMILCLPVALIEAAEQGKPPADHLCHLFVHGLLHAMGFDHLDDAEAEEMEGLEAGILAELGISNPYE